MAPAEKKGNEAVKVVVRCRPLNGKETQDGRSRIVEMDSNEGSIKINNPKSDEREPPKSTIFAYGQTGTGKSHTMEGKEEPPELRGIIPNSFVYVFDEIGKQSGSKEFLVRASYLEIYNEDVRDLLSKDVSKKLELKESADKGVYVKDLMQFVVKSTQELTSVLMVGRKNRSTGATAMNQDSSRSHSIFTITVEMTEKYDAAAAAASAAMGGKADDSHIRVGKINLVDLAGSERQSKTGATGDRLKEGIKINLSLTALGNVISALVDGKSGHIPYRDSKLTRLLQDSLGGNTKTVMVANIGPADWNYDETMSTLRYANRAKNIQNKPRINEDPKDAMLREFQEEIKRLKSLLDARGGGAVGTGSGGQSTERVIEVEGDIGAIREQLRKELEAKMQQDISAEALDKAKKDAETHARKQLEAIAGDSGKSEDERKRARHAIKAQAAEMESMSKKIEEDPYLCHVLCGISKSMADVAAPVAAAMESKVLQGGDDLLDKVDDLKKEKEQLEAKIKAMESKVLQGGENLLDKVDELKKRSEDLKREAHAHKRQEEEIKRRKAELESQQLDFNRKFDNLDDEVQVKGRQLKKLFEKYQGKKGEMADLQEQFQREREGMLEDYRVLTQQIKLKNLIIACFIPPDYQDKIMQHCHWQDYESAWNIDFLPYAGNAIRVHQDMQAGEDVRGDDTIDKLANIYFSYQSLEEEYAQSGGTGSMGAAGRPGSTSKRPGSAAKKTKAAASASGGSTLLQSYNQDQEEERVRKEASMPKARGLVKDTVDPRLRKSVAK
eukprot:gene1632-33022_t